jgi:predicted nucleic acid-binding protein
VDTNVISHLISPKRELDPGIRHFFTSVDEDRLYLSTITIGEIEKGINLLPSPKRDAPEAAHDEHQRLQAQLEQRLEALCDRFDGRIVTVDIGAARQWGRFHAEQERAGHKTPVVDTLIAACAHHNHLVLATADADFAAFRDAFTVYNPRTHTMTSPRTRSSNAPFEVRSDE